MTLHIYRSHDIKRTRMYCPHHKRLCYGERQGFYDTVNVFFDCGTFAEYGYGVFTPPKKYKRLHIWQKDDGQWELTNCFWNRLLLRKSREVVLRVAKDRLKPGGVIMINGKAIGQLAG